MKILILTSQKRVEKYYDLTKLSSDWTLIYLENFVSDDEILKVGKDADVILADAIAPVSSGLIEQMPNLKLIHSEGVAFHCIDIDAARKRGIYVCNNAALNSKAVAEQGILLMLALLRRLLEGDHMVRSGKQIQAKTSFILDGIKELSSCKVGLVGFGAIGKATAILLKAFGAQVVYYSRHRVSNEVEKEFHVSYEPLEELRKSCDIISLHLSVTKETIGFVNEAFLYEMKKTALLINTARGELVDQKALADALKNDEIAGAAFDTLSPEPVELDHPLLQLPPELTYKILFSPHIGGTTDTVFYQMHAHIWENIKKVSLGDVPENVVNGVGMADVLYE